MPDIGNDTMLTTDQLRGIFPAIPTPVTSDDRVDPSAVAAQLQWLDRQGVDGFLVLGGTGEYGALSRLERIRMAGLAVEGMGGKAPVLAGVLDPGYYDALQSAKDFALEGVDGLLVLTPYYTNPTQIGVRDYFLRFADASPVPILIYEIPYRTRISIDPEITHELSRHPNIIGMKACNLDMYHFLRLMAGVDEGTFSVLSGEDSLFPLHVAAGAKGGILVTASMLPSAWRNIYIAASSGRIATAIELHRHLIPMLNMMFAETNPGPMKSVMDLIGVMAPRVLAPLREPGETLSCDLRNELKRQLEIHELPNGARN